MQDQAITENVVAALSEDIGSGDITAQLIPENTVSHAFVITREAAVIAGTAWFDEVFHQLDIGITIGWHVADGDRVTANTRLCDIRGNARQLLTGERCALNFLQSLSGTATRVRQYVDAIQGSTTKILDTRKTIPGLRHAQKYAVTCGGGFNHRMGLYDGILIKENHIAAAGSISLAVQQAQTLNTGVAIEVEVETLAQLDEAIQAGADIVLLDNMNIAMLREAVTQAQSRVKLEASGGVNLSNIYSIAETGVDFISIGALTKDVTAVDLSMRFA